MAACRSTGATSRRLLSFLSALLLCSSLAPLAVAYRPGDIVPMLRSGQYHSSRSVWFDVVGRHCPAFAVNREVLMPIPKPTGFTGADPYKITFQIGHEKFHVPWLYVINRKSSQVPLIDFHLKYSGNDLLGVTAKVVDMPHHYIAFAGLVLSFILAIYVLQSSQEKLTRFVREAVADSSLPEGGIAKVE
ncbi:hypothetical protein PR202_ga11393 [Eleusine coracana subsp. coracana]|uniref:Signal sequence receptor subunit alpha n=1 Tax=Eleusine coracana subsp. coracana TaxID=191504 RepID=A0AAV5C9A1_ELECO|nr:hypothetical protein PR202_ga11393 [Eleusine coracana subsp. coracana]